MSRVHFFVILIPASTVPAGGASRAPKAHSRSTVFVDLRGSVWLRLSGRAAPLRLCVENLNGELLVKGSTNQDPAYVPVAD
jgi:hypothetical protein